MRNFLIGSEKVFPKTYVSKKKKILPCRLVGKGGILQVVLHELPELVVVHVGER